MRNEIESVLNSCANEMWQEWNAVNVALTQRMQESTDARNKLQTHLSKVFVLLFILFILQGLSAKSTLISTSGVETLYYINIICVKSV
jgi:hypothetical protein